VSPWLMAAAAACVGAAASAGVADGALRAVERRRARDAMPSAAVPDATLARVVADDGVDALARDRVFRTLSFTRLLANLAAGFVIGIALRGSGASAGAVAAALLVGLVVVLLAETAARAWGEARGEPAARALAPVVRMLGLLLAPVTAVAARVDRSLARSLPTPKAEELEREATAEQFRQVVAAEVDVPRDQAALLRGVFSLAETEVHEVMVPRVDIVGIEVDSPWSELLDRVRSSEHSRFPVYEETLDEIVGVLHAKDLLPAIVADEEPPDGWRRLLRSASFVPRTKTIADQLRDFRGSQTHLAFVADEFGGIAGLVTIEDVLEEIVGEIRDEYDEEEPEVEAEGADRFWVSGRLTLEELSELLGTDLEREGITTVGGLVYDHLGRVPRAGETFSLSGFRVVVERVVRRKVQRVYFERLPHVEEEDTA